MLNNKLKPKLSLKSQSIEQESKELIVVSNELKELTPRQKGLFLESLIDSTFKNLGVKCHREQYIYNNYGCWGIDHLLECNNKRVFIQAKWEEHAPSIRDMGYFFSCIYIVEKKETKQYPSLKIFTSKLPTSKNGSYLISQLNIKSIYNSDMDHLCDLLKEEIMTFFDIDQKVLDEEKKTKDECIKTNIDEINVTLKKCKDILLDNWVNAQWGIVSKKSKAMIELLVLKEDNIEIEKIYKLLVKIITTYGPTFNAAQIYHQLIVNLKSLCNNLKSLHKLHGKEYKIIDLGDLDDNIIMRANIFGISFEDSYIKKYWKDILDITNVDKSILKNIPNKDLKKKPQKIIDEYKKGLYRYNIGYLIIICVVYLLYNYL